MKICKRNLSRMGLNQTDLLADIQNFLYELKNANDSSDDFDHKTSESVEIADDDVQCNKCPELQLNIGCSDKLDYYESEIIP